MGLLAKATFSGGEPLGLLRRGQKERDGLLSPAAGAVQRAIQKFNDAANTSGAASLQGIVLEAPGGLGSEEFSAQVNRIVSAFGTASALPSRRCLVLFPGAIDRELLAHRLSKSLKTLVLSVFTADNAQAAPDIIRPYL
jgi:hypothetical protein